MHVLKCFENNRKKTEKLTMKTSCLYLLNTKKKKKKREYQNWKLLVIKVGSLKMLE